MKNRPSKATRQARQLPLDHLRSGGRHRSDGGAGGGAEGGAGGGAEGGAPPEPGTQAGVSPASPAEPAEPATPGAGDADAARGKATRSPAAVATRPHLEGSEQGPS